MGYTGAADLHAKGEGHLTYDTPLHPEARRFEGGMRNMLGLVGLGHALEELCEVGVDTIHRRVRALTDEVRAVVRARGWEVLGPDDEVALSGIVGFTHPSGPVRETYTKLTEQGCHLSYPDGRLRASPHYWTTDDEIAAFESCLPYAT